MKLDGILMTIVFILFIIVIIFLFLNGGPKVNETVYT